MSDSVQNRNVNNTFYAQQLNQLNAKRTEDTLHLYKISENGTLQLKSGVTKFFAQFLHAIGCTNQNELYLSMAPQLLRGINETMQRNMNGHATNENIAAVKSFQRIERSVTNKPTLVSGELGWRILQLQHQQSNFRQDLRNARVEGYSGFSVNGYRGSVTPNSSSTTNNPGYEETQFDLEM